MPKLICDVCGALFVEGKGFVEEHYDPCANKRHNTNFVHWVEDSYTRMTLEEIKKAEQVRLERYLEYQKDQTRLALLAKKQTNGL